MSALHIPKILRQKMLWIDITDPKYALFFNALLPHLEKLDSLLITTRKSEGYTECADLLAKFGINAVCVGGESGYGGDTLEGKFIARIKRQEEFIALFKQVGKPRVFLSGASVEGAQVAFGLGIPIVHFSDTPMASFGGGEANITLLSRLSLPLSSLIFYPFVVPKGAYSYFGVLEQNLVQYDFIDVALWLEDLQILGKNSADSKQKKAFLERFGFNDLSANKPLILAREEEYKAHYVKEKYPLFYEILHKLARENLANILIMPRYESGYLEREFGEYECVRVAKEPLFVSEFYPCIDMLIGGGGTMNLESSFLGIPTLSTRSLLLYHDKYLLDNGLMHYAKSVDSALEVFFEFKQNGFVRQDNYRFFVPKGKLGVENIIMQIAERFYK